MEGPSHRSPFPAAGRMSSKLFPARNFLAAPWGLPDTAIVPGLEIKKKKKEKTKKMKMVIIIRKSVPL